ncbi:ABC transporter substrate-binding protein [Terrarubrum flagellatum]|uniref:ABC transporter substrate-binding protein n=1 Tax=Terrirubrum flagellatum TaxID=2895980 RepID=UPI0031453685
MVFPSRGSHARNLFSFGAAIFAGLCWSGAPVAAQTKYPLTVKNCGVSVTFERAPKKVVSLGQSMTEILFSLGLGDKIAGTAVWFGPVMAPFEAENAKIKRLADNDPSFESVIAQEPDLVTAQYEWHLGPNGRVGKREQFADLKIGTYVAPADCADKDNSGSGDGVRVKMVTTAPVYQAIRELAEIFDVKRKGEELVARLQRREAEAAASVAAAKAAEVSTLFWFSSKEVKGDPFVAGLNGAPAYIMSKIGAQNVIKVNDEWPTTSWESIAATDPAVIVIARMDRRRFPADDVEVKLKFLETDPVASKLSAVRNKRIVVMDAQAMNPSIRTIDGVEVFAKSLKMFGMVD